MKPLFHSRRSASRSFAAADSTCPRRSVRSWRRDTVSRRGSPSRSRSRRRGSLRARRRARQLPTRTACTSPLHAGTAGLRRADAPRCRRGDGQPRCRSPRARELELHALEVGDRRSELAALLRVFDRVIERALCETEHLTADADAPFVQRLDGDLVALADVAENVGARY